LVLRGVGFFRCCDVVLIILQVFIVVLVVDLLVLNAGCNRIESLAFKLCLSGE